MSPFDLPGPEFLTLWFVGACIALPLCWAVSARLTSKLRTLPSIDDIVARLQPPEIAHLAGGIERAIEAVVASLHHRGVIAIEQNTLVYVEKPELRPDGTYRGFVGPQALSRIASPGFAGARSIAKRCGESIASPGFAGARSIAKRCGESIEQQVVSWVRDGMSLHQIERARDLDGELRAPLERDGLLVVGPSRVTMIAMLPMVVWIVFGGIKVVVGISRDRPVGILVALLLGAGVLAMVVARPGRLTAKGKRIVERLRDSLHGLEATASSAPQQLSSTDMMLAYGVYGASILGATALVTMMPSHQRALLAATSSTYTSSGCSSSCGGGCGGGCGGCS